MQQKNFQNFTKLYKTLKQLENTNKTLQPQQLNNITKLNTTSKKKNLKNQTLQHFTKLSKHFTQLLKTLQHSTKLLQKKLYNISENYTINEVNLTTAVQSI